MKINKNIIIGAFLGLFFAMLICLIVGLVLYFTANGMQIHEGAENFNKLVQEKAVKILIGNALIIVGAVGGGISAIILIGFTIKKFLNKKNI